jgi:hypothetical protein
MSRSNRILFSILAIVAILACNVPGGQPPTSTPDFVATITAQAALLSQPTISQPTPLPEISTMTPAPPAPTQIIFTDTPAPTATVTSTSTITLTPSSSVAMVTVSADTNCRSGPSKDYDILGALLANKSAEIVGKNTPTNYWIIKNPNRNGTCWLWGNFATVSGNVAEVKEFAIPPTPTPSIPAAVKGLVANKTCAFDGVNYKLSGTISWNDLPNEVGYRIYVDGIFLNETPKDVTISPIPILILIPGGSIKMSVEAYNSAGKSPKKSVDIVCP